MELSFIPDLAKRNFVLFRAKGCNSFHFYTAILDIEFFAIGRSQNFIDFINCPDPSQYSDRLRINFYLSLIWAFHNFSDFRLQELKAMPEVI